MWTWIISPTGRKICAYASIAIALFAIARWWGNHQWAKGEAKGRQYVADRLAKEKEKEWAEREKQLQETSASLKEQMYVLNRATAEIINARVTLRAQYDMFTARDIAQRNADEKILASVPDSELRAAIRTISTELVSAGYPGD